MGPGGGMGEYSDRIGRLQAEMARANASWAIMGATDQMRYLTGWQEGGHERLLALFVPQQGSAALVVPSINAQHAASNPAGISRVIGWNDATGWEREVSRLLGGRAEYGDLILIDDELPSGHLLALQRLMPTAQFASVSPLMATLRERKTDAELAAMSRAADLIDRAVEQLEGEIEAGMTETELCDRLRAILKSCGTTTAFEPLICFGPNGAMPHHHSGETRLEPGDMVVIDIGCEWDHYKSDITRTLSYGPPRDPDAAAVYEIVHRAQQSARAAVRPGVTAGEVDAAARTVIGAAGYGEQFIHRTGHGIGLSGHEPPYIVAGGDKILETGMCFSIEPGVYLPGRFGVRIENIVCVTESGAQSLNAEPPDILREIT